MPTSTSSGRFHLPRPTVPKSPPSTPPSPSAFSSEAIRAATYQHSKRNGIIGVHMGYPTPENNANRHNSSYTPPRQRSPSSSSDEPDAISDANDSDIESPILQPVELRKSIVIRAIDEHTDFTIEEMSENDMGYDTDKVLRPFHCEDAPSEVSARETAEIEAVLNRFENCDLQNDEPVQREKSAQQERDKEFDEAQHQRYLKKKKRWSKGGNHKRTHDQAAGSSSENEDCFSLESPESGSNTRRLRRRTQPNEQRPRRSQILEDPSELEALFDGEHSSPQST